jgi:hypothetical protein
MANTARVEQTTAAPSIQVADVIALLGSLAILISYAFLPILSNNPAVGLYYIDTSATFASLTLVVGVAGLVSAIVNMVELRDRAARWWFVGLGLLGLFLLVDNTFLADNARLKINWGTGGLLALLGCAALLAQAAIPRPGTGTANRTSDTVLGLIRILLATLWFTQVIWKLPWNNYGCPTGALVPAANTGGLCDWIGREIASPRWPAYKSFLEGFVAPNTGLMFPLIFVGEAFMTISLMLGLFTRAGALAGTLMGINLFIGLTAIQHEWDWTYLMLPALNAVFIVVGGRWIGLDALLYPRLRRLADSGNPLGRILGWFV